MLMLRNMVRMMQYHYLFYGVLQCWSDICYNDCDRYNQKLRKFDVIENARMFCSLLHALLIIVITSTIAYNIHQVMTIIMIKMMTTRMIQYCYAVHGAPYASLMYVVLWDHTSHTVPAFL